MIESGRDRGMEPGHEVRCRVCLKPIRPRERTWAVHYRGAQYAVCCPSCVQLFNRSPRQFVEEP